MKVVFAPSILKKLEQKHRVKEEEVRECFANVDGGFFKDDREDNQTDPPTHWFIAETNHGRVLCVCFMYFPDSKEFHIKTAFPPSEDRKKLYRKLLTR